MSVITIKPVVISDEYGLIAEMMAGLHENEHLLNDKTAPWAEIATAYMRHVIEMQEESGGQCLVAYEDEAPAGFIFGYVEEQDDSRIEIYTGAELYVSDGFVKPEFRRKGIYRLLNERLEQHFIAAGVRRINRFTLVNNAAMRALLEEEGYKATRVLYEKWF